MIVWAASAALFLIGLAMLVLRRQLLAMFLGVELMIVAAALALARQAGAAGQPEGFVAALVALAAAAAEAVVGLTLILRVYWSGRAPESGELEELRG